MDTKKVVIAVYRQVESGKDTVGVMESTPTALSSKLLDLLATPEIWGVDVTVIWGTFTYRTMYGRHPQHLAPCNWQIDGGGVSIR